MSEWLSQRSNWLRDKKNLFVILALLGFLLRVGYGVVRYRSQIIHLSGDAFILSWEHDAFYHVLIAKSIVMGKGYVVYGPMGTRLIHDIGEPALFKAPLYEYLLAAIYALSGFSFKLFFPIQALLGGLTTGLIGLITLRVFQRPVAAWLAGGLAAIQPILVNSASQPYNEDVFFFLYIVSVWAFLVWLENNGHRWALVSGVAAGLCTLTRENGWILLIAMGAALVLSTELTRRVCTGFAVMAIAAVGIVAPWTIRNYVRFHAFVPVASVLGIDFAQGNNECVASEGLFVPYLAERTCPQVQQKVRAILANTAFDPRTPATVRADKICKRVGLEFVETSPGSYIKLCLRRLWTTFLPFDPRGNQRGLERVVLFFYWVLVFPAGIIGTALALKGRMESGRLFLALLLVLNIASIAAVLYWSDLRFRVGIDLILGCFAGLAYDYLYARRGQRSRELLEDSHPAESGETALALAASFASPGRRGCGP